MRVIVSTTNGGLEDRVNPAFGRTPTFTIVDVENGSIINVQVVPNPGYSQPKGAGVTAAQFVIDRGANAVISGQFGPNSSRVLQAAGIRMVSAPATMTVREAVEAFLRGGELTGGPLSVPRAEATEEEWVEAWEAAEEGGEWDGGAEDTVPVTGDSTFPPLIFSCEPTSAGGRFLCDVFYTPSVMPLAIMRLWHGRVPPLEKAEEYERFLIERAVPDYGSVDGLLKIYFTRKDEEGVAHFLLVTVWDSMESIKKFAGGENPEMAKYYPEDDDFLLEKEKYVQHYRVFYEGG